MGRGPHGIEARRPGAGPGSPQCVPLPQAKSYLYYDCLVDESLSEDMVRCLPGMRFRTFSDHDIVLSATASGAGPSAGLTEEVRYERCVLVRATNEELQRLPRRYGYRSTV